MLCKSIRYRGIPAPVEIATITAFQSVCAALREQGHIRRFLVDLIDIFKYRGYSLVILASARICEN